MYEPLKEFVIKHSRDVDVFCLQEVFDNDPSKPSRIQKEARTNCYSEIKNLLPDFNSYIHSRQDNEESNAVFVRKSITLEKEGDTFLYGSKNSWMSDNLDSYPVNMEYIEFADKDKKNFLICNLHGFWTHDGKRDNPIRFEQSKKILEFLEKYNRSKIICGDFNLLPDTESIKMLEDSGLKNLIKEYSITSTRSHYYPKEHPKFADYCFVSPEVEVKDFKVLPDVVSDHLPLYLEFE